MQWKEEYSVKVDEIDEQHKKLIGIINELHVTVSADEVNEDNLGRIFKELVDYADYHFETEEKYFEMFDYPQKEEHKLKHIKYTQKVLDWYIQYNNSKIGISLEVTDFLVNWWTNHILNIDREYSQFFNEHGLH